MTDMELAEEIERRLRNDSSLDPTITLAETTWLEIIAALRRGPERPSSGEMVMVPRQLLRDIQSSAAIGEPEWTVIENQLLNLAASK